MPFINNLTSNPQNEILKAQYQPQFPLMYDTTFGPYRPITSEVESIQQNFKNLLLTNPGEWPMNPKLGIGLRRYLFENFESPELKALKQRTTQQLQEFLPEVQLYDVRFHSTDQDKDEGFIKISFVYAIFTSSYFEMNMTVGRNSTVQAAITNMRLETDVFLASSRNLTSGIRESTA